MGNISWDIDVFVYMLGMETILHIFLMTRTTLMNCPVRMMNLMMKMMMVSLGCLGRGVFASTVCFFITI